MYEPSNWFLLGLCLLIQMMGMNSKEMTRVSHGLMATDGDFPHVVALYQKSTSSPYCGGFIVSDRYVVTAAHCFDDASVSQVGLVLGRADLRKGSGLIMDAKRFIPHPEYDEKTLINDIGLIELVDEIPFSSTIQKAVISEQNVSFGTLATVAGWGLTENQQVSPVQRFASLKIQKPAFCEINQTPYFLCASDDRTERRRDSCTGDSGGPLFFQVCESDAFTALGIVSYGTVGCGHASSFGVYTNMFQYRDWIETTVGNDLPRSKCSRSDIEIAYAGSPYFPTDEEYSQASFCTLSMWVFFVCICMNLLFN